MRHKFFSYVILLIISLGLVASELQAQEALPSAGLLVTPTRIILEGKRRSAAITLTNNGGKRGVYKISFVNKRMTEEGKILTIEEPDEGERFADDFLRISPRRVTLEPGEFQSVRILARKPQGLEEGEYRSHMRFAIVPEDVAAKLPPAAIKDQAEGVLTISVRANYGVTIPVIVRHGDLQSTGKIEDIGLGKNDKGETVLNFAIYRTGTASLYGDVEVTFIDAKGESFKVKSQGGMAVYTPNEKRRIEFTLDVPERVNLSNGTLHVTYREKAKDGGKLIAESKLVL